MPDLQLHFLCTLFVELGDPIEMGPTEKGNRRIIPITGGKAVGDRLSGVILNLGADWQTIYGNGTAELDTRYAMKTADNATIDIRNRGYRVCSPEVQAKIAAGVAVQASEYSMISTPRFETAAENYLWLNSIICVAKCERNPDSVRVDISEVRTL